MSVPVQVGPPVSSGGPVPSLTAIELVVLEGVANGIGYQVLARRYGYTYKSIREVGRRVLSKLEAEDLPHAVFLACRAGILDGRPERHGDHAGFAAHVRRGEDPWACDKGCPEGERAYRREQKAARRAAKAAAA
jgi:hypothetical protein